MMRFEEGGWDVVVYIRSTWAEEWERKCRWTLFMSPHMLAGVDGRV